MNRTEFFKIDTNEEIPIFIGCGQTSTPEWMIDKIIDAAELQPKHIILEIGTGCGYQTYKLAQKVKRVYTIERFQKLSRIAKEKLDDFGIRNVRYRFGDGTQGWGAKKFERIIVCATAEMPPTALLRSLKIGGILLIPVGDVLKMQTMVKIVRHKNYYTWNELWPIRSVPLVGGKDGCMAESKS